MKGRKPITDGTKKVQLRGSYYVRPAEMIEKFGSILAAKEAANQALENLFKKV